MAPIPLTIPTKVPRKSHLTANLKSNSRLYERNLRIVFNNLELISEKDIMSEVQQNADVFLKQIHFRLCSSETDCSAKVN